jgi:sugar phosphate isomerase/epimerase
LAEARGGRLIPGEGGLDLAGIVRALPSETVISVEVPSAKNNTNEFERARNILDATHALLAKDPK